MITLPIQRGSSAQFEVFGRDVSQETLVSAELVLPYSTENVEALYIPPPLPRYRVERALRTSDVVQVRSTGGNVLRNVCLDRTTGFLLPDTARWSGPTRDPANERATLTITDRTDLRVCGLAFANGRRNPDITARASGALAVEEMIITVEP